MRPVLLNRATAEGIVDGSITLVLRHWDVPRAKAGGRQRTQAGTIRVGKVTEYAGDHRVTDEQARAAGYPDAAAAQAELDRRPAKHVYAIEVSYIGPDERPALAAVDALTNDDVAAIRERLARLDAASSTGPWTRRYLELVRDNEAVRAPDLAAREGLDVGYRISPRGNAFLPIG